MKLTNLLGVAAIAVASSSASATIYNYDFTWNGTNLTTNASAAGNVLLVGDTVNASFNAAGNDYWTATPSDFIWAPIGVQDAGARYGDMSWIFSLNGNVVDSGSLLNFSDLFVHITQSSHASTNIAFDQLTWSYIFNGSTASTNLLGSLIDDNFGSLSPAVYVHNQEVPEPSGLLLLGLGLVSISMMRRNKAK